MNRIYSLRVCMEIYLIIEDIISFFDSLADNINLVVKKCVGWVRLTAPAAISSRA